MNHKWEKNNFLKQCFKYYKLKHISTENELYFVKLHVVKNDV